LILAQATELFTIFKFRRHRSARARRNCRLHDHCPGRVKWSDTL